MRSTDDLQDKEPFRPFGPKVSPPPDLAPEWKPRPGSPGIFENREGKVRTDMPPPIVPPTRVA
jgi:hypothetical protein